MDLRTVCAQGGRAHDVSGEPLAPPIVAASTFAFRDQRAVEDYYEEGRGWLYSRYENPTVRDVEAFLARLEGGEEAALFGSGMAAISTTLLALLSAGDRVAAQVGLYGGTVGLLRDTLCRLGVEIVWLDLDEVSTLSPERIAGCRLLYLETPVNPTLRIVDLRAASAAAREAGVITAVDSTFATPVFQRPLALGCDLVIHSATKYLGGHCDLTAGAVIGPRKLVERIARQRRGLGGVADPFAAFLLHRGLKTLPVRMEAHARGAAAVSRALREHPRVLHVHWPGLPDHPDHQLASRQMTGYGGMVSFEVEGGARAAERVHDRLRLFVKAASLGGTESLASVPARMSHRHMTREERERAGVADALIRLSVGLEAPEDLVEDLDQALRA